MTGPAWLFCPADRPERFGKAALAADVVILDLEDAVAPDAKPAARVAVQRADLDPATTVVRVNADPADDLEALRRSDFRTLMLPKCESAAQVEALTGYEVVVLLETPRGVLHAEECAAAGNAVGVMWGAEDLVAAMGGTSSRWPSGGYRDYARHARSTALLAAHASGRLALDAVYLDLGDEPGLRAEADDAVAVGFGAKVAIHPKQVPVIRAAFTPSAAELAWARGVLAAAATERGVFAYEGRMVDAPVLRHAEAIVRRA